MTKIARLEIELTYNYAVMQQIDPRQINVKIRLLYI